MDKGAPCAPESSAILSGNSATPRAVPIRETENQAAPRRNGPDELSPSDGARAWTNAIRYLMGAPTPVKRTTWGTIKALYR